MRISIRASMLVGLSVMLTSPGLLHGSVSLPSYGVRQIVYPIGETSPTPFGANLTGGSINNPGLYALSNDINGGITIDSDDVYLNLNGYRIHVTGSGSPVVGVNLATGKHDITVQNGTIGPDTQVPDTIGVQLNNNQRFTIASCYLVNNAQGLVIHNSQGIAINQCEALNSTMNGFALQDCSNVHVSKSAALGTQGSGSVNGFITADGQHNVFDCCTAQDTVTTCSSGNTTGCSAAGFNFAGKETKSILQNSRAQGSYAAMGGSAYGVLFPGVTFSPAIGLPDPLIPWPNVTSVAWCCDDQGKYLAVGDAYLGAFVFVFAPQDVGNEFPTVIPVPAPSGRWYAVSSVDWCCTGTTKFLAVGDRGNGGYDTSGAYVYSFDPAQSTPFGTAIPVLAPSNAGFWHYVDSVAWCCNGTTQYLAVGDAFISGAYVYSFDPTKTSPFGAAIPVPAPSGDWKYVDSVAWCCDGTKMYLAVGDGGISGAYVYSFDPAQSAPFGAAIHVPAPSNPGDWQYVLSVAWCCDGTKMYLAVGDGEISGAYAYSFDGKNFTAVPVPKPSAGWYSVSSVAWCCTGTTKYLAVGDGGNGNSGTSGAYAYSFDGTGFSSGPIPVPVPSTPGTWFYVYSVAWCCDGTTQYLAVGDYYISGAYVYSFDASATPPTFMKTTQDPLTFGSWNISSVAWCCSGIYSYLAVANQGATPGVFVFSFNSITGAFTQTSTSLEPREEASWQTPTNVAWCCGSTSNYLVVTDQKASSLPIVFQFDPVGETFTQIQVISTEVISAEGPFSSSLCCDATGAYLAAAYHTEIITFVFDPTNNVFNLVTNGTLSGFTDVSSISWCCGGPTKYLVVGDAGSNPSSVNAYSFDPTQTNPFGNPIPVPVPTSTNFGAVSSVAWCCDGINSYLAVGDAGNSGTSPVIPSGAYVYSFDQVNQVFTNALPVPAPAGGWSNVNSVAWCCGGNGTCLAVGDAVQGAYGYSFNGTTGTCTPIMPNPMPSSGTWGTVSSVAWCCGGTSSCLAVASSTANKGAYAYCLQGNNLIIRSNTATDTTYNTTGSAYGFSGNDIANLVVSNIAYQNSTNYNGEIYRVTTDYGTDQYLYNFSAN